MQDCVIKQVPCMDTNDLFLFIGFCPDYVEVENLETGNRFKWARHLDNDNALEIASTGTAALTSGAGIKLVKFTGEPWSLTADPSAVNSDEWYDANGIQITSDAALLADDDMLVVKAYRMDEPIIRSVHDGGSNKNTYWQDSSMDFKKAGVSGGQTWIIYNKSNGNYAFIGAVQKPTGQSKYCRLTVVNSAGDALTAFDSDDNDIAIIMKKSACAYPMSDIVAAT